MSKALELTIYPPLELPMRGADIMAYRSQFIDEQLIIQHKRLTDAELASEFHSARLNSRVRMARVDNQPGNTVVFDHYERGLEQEWWLERFAMHSHYDEVV